MAKKKRRRTRRRAPQSIWKKIDLMVIALGAVAGIIGSWLVDFIPEDSAFAPLRSAPQPMVAFVAGWALGNPTLLSWGMGGVAGAMVLPAIEAATATTTE